MNTVKITLTEAQTACAYLDAHGTPAAAAHQVRIQRRAIEPYTDRHLEAVQFILYKIAHAEAARRPEVAAKAIAQLRAIAGRTAVRS